METLKKPMNIEIQIEGKAKIIGQLVKRTFYKQVKQSVHLLRKADSWGIQADIFRDVLKNQCDFIRIKDVETGSVYVSTYEAFDKFGVYKNFRPHGLQKFLARRYFDIYDKEGNLINERPLAVKKFDASIVKEKIQTTLL